MTSCIRVLSVQTIDSSPSLLVVSPSGKKILVNCGEGCQRIFLEFGQKVSTVDRVCLTHLGHESMGGLPGMILTAADVVKQAVENAIGSQKNQEKSSSATTVAINDAPSSPLSSVQLSHSLSPEGLTIIGPIGTEAFIQSLRHFMRRESFPLDIKEGNYRETKPERCYNKNGKKKRTTKDKEAKEDDNSLLIQSIAAYHDPSLSLVASGVTNSLASASDNQSATNSKKRPLPKEDEERYPLGTIYTPPTEQSTHGLPPRQHEVLSFLFKTPPIPGKFLVDKARELGIPPGPLYGQLKAGRTITFPKHPNNNDGAVITVESHQVVEPGSPGVILAVLYYPTMEVLHQLQTSKELVELQKEQSQSHDDNLCLDLIVHMTPRAIFESNTATSWRDSFGINVRHMFVHMEDSCIDQINSGMNANEEGASLTPFHSACAGAMIRSEVSSDVFQRPHVVLLEEHEWAAPKGTPDYLVVQAVPLLEYILLPRGKRGFQNQNTFLQHWKDLRQDSTTILAASGCVETAQKLLNGTGESKSRHEGEIIFTGTGSAIPCKHRNVSGIHVRMANANSILLDCGEGTVGAILRAKQNREKGDNVLRNIKAVWISHPHADHHLGLLRLLAEKRKLTATEEDPPLIVIAPPNMLAFLKEYEQVEPGVIGSFSFLDCRAISPQNSASTNSVATGTLQRLREELGITSVTAIPVSHCRHSFAVVFRCSLFDSSPVSLAYSGDCRPSYTFAEVAQNVDILIHEATFADGMETEAVVKRHCTVGEALKVAHKMKAKTTLLTHFSQRYPKIPPLPRTNTDMNMIPVFDFMRITPANVTSATMLTPVLRLLYPETSGDDEGECMGDRSREAMQIPGLFTNTALL